MADEGLIEFLGTGEHYQDADLYEHEYKRRRQDVYYYASLAMGQLPSGSDILELCCGSGRVSRALLRRGFHVTGIDISEAMLERARSSTARLPLYCRNNGTFLVGDMRDFDLRRRFPMVISTFNSLEHLYTLTDIQQCLRRVRAHLLEDGYFAFDVQMPDLAWLLKDPGKRWARTKFRHPKTHQLLAYSTNHIYDAAKQIAYIRLYYEPLEEGPLQETQVVHLSQRKYFPQELESLLDYEGFEVLVHQGDFSGDDLDEFAESQVLLCRLRER